MAKFLVTCGKISAFHPCCLGLVIVVAKLQSIDSHRLWSFELFAWAMLNMVYMVTVMTIKRIIEKNDEKFLSNDDS